MSELRRCVVPHGFYIIICGLAIVLALMVLRAQAQEKAASQATSQAASQPTGAWTAADEERYRLIGTAALRPIDPRSMPDYRKTVDLPPTQPWDDAKTIIIKKSTATPISDYYDGKLIPAAQYKNIEGLPRIINDLTKELTQKSIRERDAKAANLINALTPSLTKVAITYTREYKDGDPFVYYKGDKESIVEFSQVIRIEGRNRLDVNTRKYDKGIVWIQFLAACKVPNEVLPKLMTTMQIEVQPTKIDDVFKTVQGCSDQRSKIRIHRYSGCDSAVFLVQADVIRIQPLDNIPAINDKIPIPEWAAAFNQSKLATAKARVVNPNDLMLADKWPIVAERYMRFEPSVANDYLVYTTNCPDRPEQYNFASKLSPGASQLQYEFMTSVTDYETGLAVPKDYQAFKGFTSTQLKALMPAKWPDMVSKVNGMYLITPKSKISFNDFGLIITCDLVQMSKELGTEAKQ